MPVLFPSASLELSVSATPATAETADSLKYLTVEQLVESCKDAKIGFCLGCFNGEYPYSLEGYKPSKFKFE